MTNQTRPSIRRSLDQERAEKAWNAVNAIIGKDDKKLADEYLTLARKAPSMIQTNGLGQTLGFLNAKGEIQKNKGNPKKVHHHIYNDISDWVLTQIAGKKTDFITWLVKQDSAIYRMATNETLAYLQWLKRFAEASLKSADDGKLGEEKST